MTIELRGLRPETLELLSAAMPKLGEFLRRHQDCGDGVRFTRVRIYCPQCEQNAQGATLSGPEHIAAYSLQYTSSARATMKRERKGKKHKQRHRHMAKKQSAAEEARQSVKH